MPCGKYITRGRGPPPPRRTSIGRMGTTPGPPDPMATLRRRRWRLLAVTGMGAFLGPFDVSVAAVALPAIGRDLDLTFSGAIWIQAGYLLPYALVLIPAGRIADQWGRLRVFRIGMVVFAVTSLMAALSPNIEWMLSWRAVQGAGGAMLAATSTALVTAAFPPSERGRALGLNIMVLYLGLSTGPLIGGLLVDHAGWRWIFLASLPVAAASLLLGLPLHEGRTGHGRVRLDPAGTLTLGAALASVMVGLTFGPIWGWESARVVGLLCAGAVLLVAFGVIESRASAPLIDLGMFRRSRIVALGSAASLLNYTAMFGAIALTAVLLEVVGGRSPSETGLVMMAQPLVMVALSPVAGHLSDSLGSRALASGGMLILAAGLAILATTPSDLPLWHIVTGLAVSGLGMACFSSPNTSAVMGAVERDKLGVAAAVLAMMRTLGQTLSLAILGTLAAAPLGAAGAGVLFGQTGDVANAALYLDGYRVAMGVGAAIAVVGACLSLSRGPVVQSPAPAATS